MTWRVELAIGGVELAIGSVELAIGGVELVGLNRQDVVNCNYKLQRQNAGVPTCGCPGVLPG
ncbi:MAG: hypothetical protein ACRDQ7_12575, partial [Haloechinothrix sp.]